MDRMLTPDNFSCTQCGKCCMGNTVKLTDSDIRRIEKRGLRMKDFAEPDGFDPQTGKFSLRKKGGMCMFLEKEGSAYSCSIYDARPDICRKYPFFDTKPIESCLPEVLWKIS